MTATWMRTVTAAAFLSAGLASVEKSSAAICVNEFDVTLFARVWHVSSYFVQDDLLAAPQDDTFLEPEGLAFRNGVLYASGDREPDETDGRLAVYAYPPEGPLSFSGLLQMPNEPPNWWGPEGIAFNATGGGYGSGSMELVSVERDTPSRAGVIDLLSGTVSDLLLTDPLEDVTFLPGREEFAVLVDLGTSMRVALYDSTIMPTAADFAVLPGSNGLVGVGTAFGSWFTWTAQTQEMVLVVTKAAPGNAVAAYGLDGAPIGSVFHLPLEPKARIPLGGGFYRLLPAFGTVEAVTVDEIHKTIFLGDEQNSMIHVLTGGLPAVDFNDDGSIDLGDLVVFEACLEGPGIAPTLECTACDLDADSDVDLADFSVFQAALGSG
ncbi:MAG: dockerin type I domain-containing protein [Planctomycetota bacterium]